MQGSGSSSNSRLRDDLGRLPSSEDEVLKAFEQTSFGDLSLGDVVGNGPRALQAFLDGVRNVREEATNALRQNDSVGSGSDSEKQRNERVARLRQQFQDRGAKHQAYAAAVHNR
jgi:hypothetical protein